LVNGPNATSLNAGYSIWLWYTDVELFGATTIVPQATKLVKKGKNPTNEEERPLSSWLSSSAKLADSLSSVPYLSSITGPSSLWLKYASGLAHSFGFSRPVQGEPVHAMAPHYMNSVPNADGLNVGSVMAWNKDARCRLIDDYSPSGMDEMSINFIKRQWSFIREFSFTTAQAAGTQIENIRLAPGMGSENVPSFGLSMAPIEFMAYLCRFYRGGVELCFKFVKTGFHSGSLQFSYEIGRQLPAGTRSIQETSVLHRTVVDIQQGDSVCLAFPFVCVSDFLETFESYGRCYVHVINPLVAPETVANSIVVQVYARGMDDLEFSGISNQNGLTPSVLQPIIEPQGKSLEKNDEIICEPVGDALQMQEQTGLQMMDSMSESVNSLMQFAKMGNLLQFRINTVDSPQTIAFTPGAWTVSTRAPGGVQQRAPPFTCNVMNAIKSLYAYQRGGYEVNILPSLLNVNADNNNFAYTDNNFGAPPTFELVPNGNIGFETTMVAPGLDPRDFLFKHFRAANNGRYGLSVTVPYRCRYRVSPIFPIAQTAGIDSPGDPARDFSDRTRVHLRANTSSTVLLRGAEDFQLLYWVGVPPLFVRSG
jgi:hypothetical protein